jgi:hypothetical protein
MDINLKQEQGLALVQRMQMGMQMSIILEKPGEDFWNAVKEVESSDIFHKLHGAYPHHKVISINPIKRYIPLSQPAAIEAPGLIDTEHLLDGWEGLLEKVRQMGKESFAYYFLEGMGTPAEVSEILGIPAGQVKAFREKVIDQVQIADAFSDSGSRPAPSPGYAGGEVVAEIYFLKEGIQIDYARQKSRYRINDENLSALLSQGSLSPEDVGQFRKLRRQMEWINFRFDLLHRIVEMAVDHQEEYLKTLDPSRLRELELQKISGLLGVDPSWTSRLLREKYIKCQNRIISLRKLFISGRELKKSLGKILLEKILKRQAKRLKEGLISRPYTDQEICNQLQGEHGMKVSRRSINNWQRELERESGLPGEA